MGVARRVQRIAEDAGDESECYAGFGISDADIEPLVVPLWPEMGELSEEFTTPLDDAMAHVVDTRDAWPDWHCDNCGTPNGGRWLLCGMCGVCRDDVDP
jgi:hypothetical protein